MPAEGSAETVYREAVDVTDADAVEHFGRRVAEKFGAIDLWINNAGVLEPIRPVRGVSADELRHHLDVNVVGVLNGTRAFVDHLRGREGGGVLVNISSGAARNAYEGWGAYCAGKAAVDRLTEVVALEEAESGLKAYALAPGVVDTDMQELIRQQEAEDFPTVEIFRQMKEDDSFSSMDDVAKGMLDLVFGNDARDEVLIDLRR